MRQLGRLVVITIGFAEILLGFGFGAYVLDTDDTLGSKIAGAIATLIAIALAGSVLPGMLLAWRDRFLALAAALVLGGPPFWFYLMAQA